MTAFVVLLLGLACLGVGLAAVSRLGRAWRVGRLLAGARQVALDEVAAMARAGRQAFVRTHGRIASDEEFPDENQRPLVYRRRRLQLAGRRSGWMAGERWSTFDDERVGVPFGLEEQGTHVAVDLDALGDGLVVMPRESAGTIAELPPIHAAKLPRDSTWATGDEVRLLVEQVSAVEHATVAGVPALGPDGQPKLTAGLGRPLILTTLEPDEAMRLLGSGHRGRLLAATTLLIVGLVLVCLGLLMWLVGA